MKKVAIVQSNYIPWKGYFDLINSVDEFMLYDDAQYTKRDWRNRNMIKSSTGPLWLSIPVEVKGKYTQKIKDVRCVDSKWKQTHWKTIVQAYSSTPHFKEYAAPFEVIYNDKEEMNLSKINATFIREINSILGIKTKISATMDYQTQDADPTEKLLNYCKQAGANHYLSGPRAKDYLKVDLFSAENIEVTFYDYNGYAEYNQLYPPFSHFVSVLDLIFNHGAKATSFMKSFT